MSDLIKPGGRLPDKRGLFKVSLTPLSNCFPGNISVKNIKSVLHYSASLA